MIVGVDIGTQSLKAIVADERLCLRGEAAVAYQPDYPRQGWAEQSPLLWEKAMAPAIAAALAAAGAPASAVTALGICGQLDGCLAVDGQGRPLGPCIIWIDRRAQAEMEGLPEDLIHRRTGIVPDASHMAAKIRWLKRHGTGAAAFRRFHQPVSYMVERLTGESTMDHALASTTMLYSLADRRFDAELLGLFETDEGELPRIAEAAGTAGRLHREGAALTGLPAGIPVAVGTGDDFAATLGAGPMRPGRAVAALGTGEVVSAVHGRPVIDSERLVETHAYPAGGYFIENPGWLAGGAVAWLSGVLGIEDYGEFDRLAGEVPAGSDGLVFLPTLTGAMSPRWVAAARGCFYGLSPAHGRGHLARALLEGCAFAMRDVVERLGQLTGPIDHLLLLGGGARSRLWARIRADLTGLPVFLPRQVDTTAVGAALLAAVAGSGGIESVAAAGPLVETTTDPLAPDPAARAALEDAYGRYRLLFDSLTPMFTEAPRQRGGRFQDPSHD
jgi:xylulokinase